MEKVSKKEKWLRIILIMLIVLLLFVFIHSNNKHLEYKYCVKRCVTTDYVLCEGDAYLNNSLDSVYCYKRLNECISDC